MSGILNEKIVYGYVEDAKLIPGRKRKTSQRQDRIVVRKSKADRFKTAPQTKAEMQIDYGVDISVSTTRRRLREAELNGYRPRKKPRLTSRHKKKRLDFAKHTKIGQLNNGHKSCSATNRGSFFIGVMAECL